MEPHPEHKAEDPEGVYDADGPGYDPDDLEGDDAYEPPEPKIRTALPPRLESWRRRSAAGAILTGIGLGLREALEPKRDEPAILVVTSGDPPTDMAVEADLSGIVPSANVVRIRPWLLDKANNALTETGGPQTEAAAAPTNDAPTNESS